MNRLIDDYTTKYTRRLKERSRPDQTCTKLHTYGRVKFLGKTWSLTVEEYAGEGVCIVSDRIRDVVHT